MAHDTCWDPHGQAIIGRAVKAGFDVTEVEDELKPSWGASRFDSRNSGVPWLPSGSARPPAPAARILQRTETEEELRRINNRRELYEAKKQLNEQEVQDAARTNNYTEVREHDRVASVRVPKAPAAPPNVLAVLRDVPPLLPFDRHNSWPLIRGHAWKNMSRSRDRWSPPHGRLRRLA